MFQIKIHAQNGIYIFYKEIIIFEITKYTKIYHTAGCTHSLCRYTFGYKITKEIIDKTKRIIGKLRFQ